MERPYHDAPQDYRNNPHRNTYDTPPPPPPPGMRHQADPTPERPYGREGCGAPYGAPSYYGAPVDDPFRRRSAGSNGLGTAGFVLAVIGLVFCWIPVIGALVAVLGLIFSAIGLARAPRGLAIAGFVVALLTLGLMALGALALIGMFAEESGGWV